MSIRNRLHSLFKETINTGSNLTSPVIFCCYCDYFCSVKNIDYFCSVILQMQTKQYRQGGEDVRQQQPGRVAGGTRVVDLGFVDESWKEGLSGGHGDSKNCAF